MYQKINYSILGKAVFFQNLTKILDNNHQGVFIVTTIKGTNVLLASFKDRLKDTLENRQRSMEEGKQPIADLLFHFLNDVTGYLDVAVVHVHKLRSGSGSPHSTKKPTSLRLKVVSVLGEIGGVLYYCRKGNLCVPHQDAGRPTLAYPQVRALPWEDISEELALTLIKETMKLLELFVNSKRDPVPRPCDGFVIRYSIRSIDRTAREYKFAFIKKSDNVQNYKQATEVFSAKYKSDHAQKRLQVMEEIMIYAGQWISIEKSLSPEASIMDSKIGGITPTDLMVSEQPESTTV